MSQVITKEDISPFDIDDTLIMTDNTFDLNANTVEVEDPLNKGTFIEFKRNESMIRLLKEQHHRGSFILVWSRGGYEWAETVVKALALSDYVDLIMSKPKTYFDDTPVEKWLTDRVYLTPDANYKQGV